MKIQWAVSMLAGSIVVHAIVVACSPVRNAGADGSPAGADGSPGNASGEAVQVADEPCDKTYPLQEPLPRPGTDAGNTVTEYYAEHAYPGKSKEEIAGHVTHWTQITDSNKDIRPPPYVGGLNLQSAVYTRDGYAGAGCDQGTVTHFIWHP
jgi:hypothetical protein